MFTGDKIAAQWFAMRVTYKRELIAKQLLDEQGVENFVAMHYVLKQHRERKMRVLEPVVHNLIFVRTSWIDIMDFKRKVPYVQFMMRKMDGSTQPIVVRDADMDNFIRVSQTYDDGLVYLNPADLDLAKGTRVKIHGGAFDGLEGTFLKVKGKRNKRVVVAIQDVLAVAAAYVQPDYIEVIK